MTGKDRMCMRIDEARCYHSAFGVIDHRALARLDIFNDVVRFANRHNSRFMNRNRAVLDDIEFGHIRASLRPDMLRVMKRHKLRCIRNN